MAIQNRRGGYGDFDPTKLKPGEFAVIQSGDPNSNDGKAVYICTQTGIVRRLVSELEVVDLVRDAISDVIPEIPQVDAVPTQGSTNAVSSGGVYSALDTLQAQIPQIDPTLTQSGKPADAKAVGVNLKLLCDEIPNTTQTYVFNDGKVAQINHINSGNTIRTDTFSYGQNQITEVRTLNTGESLTIQTNLTTLETIVTYSAT